MVGEQSQFFFRILVHLKRSGCEGTGDNVGKIVQTISTLSQYRTCLRELVIGLPSVQWTRRRNTRVVRLRHFEVRHAKNDRLGRGLVFDNEIAAQQPDAPPTRFRKWGFEEASHPREPSGHFQAS